jgi:endo-1,4-beta-xylanase
VRTPFVRLAAALVCCAAVYGQPLRDLAERHGIKLGAAVNPALLDNAEYAATLAREFNQAEPENAMKFGPIHPAADRFNFEPADRVVTFAVEHKIAVRGHTLVWHNQNPAWIAGGALDAEASAAAMREHIGKVVGHFAGKVYAWDVVNEAFTDQGERRKTVWSVNADYIEQAFRLARQADPEALLFYNDFSAEGMNAKSDAIYAMARDFKTRGVPLDGIGLQMHLTKKTPPMDSVEANIKRITELGLQVQITELDVRVPIDESGAAAPADLEAQAKIYRDVFAACLKFPKCSAIQVWGFTDRYSWIPRTYRGFGAALPFDAAYKAKPAYEAIKAALR